MANANIVFGFRPVQNLDGSPWSGATRTVYFPSSDSTATFVGDLVKLTGSGDADGKYATVAQCAAGDTPYGVVVGFKPDPTDLELTYRKASTARYAEVAVGDAVIMEAQEDSVGGALAAANIGQNIDVVVASSGDTTSGLSGMQLDSSTAATTNTLPLRLIGLVDREDNALGTNAKWLVRLNLSEFRATTGV